MQNFLSLTFTSTYRKKPLVVEVPFSHVARKFALRVERVFFCSLGWHGHENKKSVKISVYLWLILMLNYYEKTTYVKIGVKNLIGLEYVWKRLDIIWN